jgi:DNA-binding beta-propeller fold protein YncE
MSVRRGTADFNPSGTGATITVGGAFAPRSDRSDPNERTKRLRGVDFRSDSAFQDSDQRQETAVPRRLDLAAIIALALPASLAAQADAPSGTVIVAGMNADAVWLIDLPSGEHRGTVATHIAPHEVAVSGDGRLAVVTNYGDQRGPGNLIQLLDVQHASIEREIVIDGYERIHGAAFLEGDSLLAVTSERTGEILVVGLADGAIRRKLPTGGRATHMLSPGGDWIYAANIVDGTVSRIDPAGTEPTRTWAAGTRTEGVAATPDGRQGWTGSMEGGEVTGVDGATGDVVARITGLQVPYRLAVTPDGETIVVSDPPAGQLVLIDRAVGAVRARVDITAAAAAEGLTGDVSPQGFTLSRDGRWAFVSTKAIDRVAIVDLANASVLKFLEAAAGPDGIAFSPVRGAASRTP